MDLVFNTKEHLPIEDKIANTFIIIRQSQDLPNNKNMLDALLNAIKLTPSDYNVLIHQSESKFSVPHGYTKGIVFGLQSEDLPNMNPALNKIITFDECRLIATHSLTELSQDPKKKMALWQTLQKLFL